MEKQLIQTLVKIAHHLNLHHIYWVLGGSLMLKLNGLVDDPQDIDLMVSLEDAEKADKVLKSLGSQLPKYSTQRYETQHFHEYLIDGVDVDMIAGFAINSKNIIYQFPLDQSKPRESIELSDEIIYLDSLSVWLEYYRLMDRKDKVSIIENHLKSGF